MLTLVSSPKTPAGRRKHFSPRYQTQGTSIESTSITGDVVIAVAVKEIFVDVTCVCMTDRHVEVLMTFGVSYLK